MGGGMGGGMGGADTMDADNGEYDDMPDLDFDSGPKPDEVD
jgi:hypothetical protein